MKKVLYVLGLCCLYCVLGANGNCGQDESDRIQNKKQEELSKIAVQTAGLPAIVNFQEKRTLKMILELRDTAINTYTYIVDLNGNLHKICNSVGYGIPYATQYTNPSKMADDLYHDSTTLPQADPNGLFSPPSAEGTWVSCLNPQSKKVVVIYIEPRIIVSPYDLLNK